MARPASAQEVVEAIRAIERELLAERQKAELSQVAPRPGDVDALKQLEVGIEKGPLEPRPSVRPGAGRRTRWITAAVLAEQPRSRQWGALSSPRFARPGSGSWPTAQRLSRLLTSESSLKPRPRGRRAQSHPNLKPSQIDVRPGEKRSTVCLRPYPKARDSSPVVKTGDERPGPEQREPKGSPVCLTKGGPGAGRLGRTRHPRWRLQSRPGPRRKQDQNRRPGHAPCLECRARSPERPPRPSRCAAATLMRVPG